MGELTEVEIFDCMYDNLRQAIGACEELATRPLKGPSYVKLRGCLKLIEGCCRQASAWREDTRWLPLGLQMDKAHRLAQEWLLGVIDPETGRRRMIPEGTKHPMFVGLGDLLKYMLTGIEALRKSKTGRTGAILPVPLPGPHRQVKDNYAVMLPAGMQQRASGLIVPSDVAA